MAKTYEIPFSPGDGSDAVMLQVRYVSNGGFMVGAGPFGSCAYCQGTRSNPSGAGSLGGVDADRQGDDMTRFCFTEAHEKLLRAAYVEWNNMYAGAPGIDPKRPYGNSDVAGDVCQILGWQPSPSDWSPAQRALAMRIHLGTHAALQIVLSQPGQASHKGHWVKDSTRGWWRAREYSPSDEPSDPGHSDGVPYVGMIAFWKHDNAFLHGVITGVGAARVTVQGYGTGQWFAPLFCLPPGLEADQLRADLEAAKYSRDTAQRLAQDTFAQEIRRLTAQYVDAS